MEEKIIEFKKSADICRNIAIKRLDRQDYIGALNSLFDAKKMSDNPEILADIAQTYSEMGLFEMSNKYWFLFLSKGSKKKSSRGYEALAINYFYMNNFALSGYYIDKKIKVDGFLREDDLDQEMMEFFQGKIKNHNIKLIYPEEKADYKEDVDQAERLISECNIKGAKALLKKVPKKNSEYCRALELLSTVYLLDEDAEKGISVCREIRKLKGESVSLMCRLSSFYGIKKDYEHRSYYYNLAKSLPVEKDDDYFKLAFCAFEQKDDEFCVKTMDKIVSISPYDINMFVFYAFALINTGDYELALKQLQRARMINPFDLVVKFYYNLTLKLKNGGKCQFLPLDYVFEVPDKEYRARIKKLTDGEKLTKGELNQFVKKKDIAEILEWGLFGQNETLCESSAIMLMSANNIVCDRLLLKSLIEPTVKDSIKRMVLYHLIINGKVEKIPVVAYGIFSCVKPKKLPITDQVYLSGYALALTTLVFYGETNFDFVAVKTLSVFKRLQFFKDEKFTREEIAIIILSLAKDTVFNDIQLLCSAFNVKKERINHIEKLYKGELND